MPEITIGPDFPPGWPAYGSYHIRTSTWNGRWELYRLRYSLAGGGVSWVCEQ